MQSTRLPRLAGVLVLAIVVASAAIVTLVASSPSPAAPQLAAPAGHQIVSAKTMTWGDPPSAAPGGARMAVIQGDPSKPEEFTIRIKLPDGSRVPPHWHPNDEHLTIIQGTFMVGMGEKFDVAALKPMNVGDFLQMPKEMRHFATTKGETIVQVHGIGPFTINYVNPSDDPRNKKTSPSSK